MTTVYEKRGNMRIYAGFGVCLIVLLLRCIGIEIPDIVMGACAFGIIPYIIINAYIVEYQEKKHECM